jgi:hypothetical protein
MIGQRRMRVRLVETREIQVERARGTRPRHEEAANLSGLGLGRLAGEVPAKQLGIRTIGRGSVGNRRLG